MKRDVFYARARNYGSSLEAALAADNIPAAGLPQHARYLPAQSARVAPLLEIRRRALGVDKLHVYDIYVPLDAQRAPISYDEAREMICEGMAPLGDEYLSAPCGGLYAGALGGHLPQPGQGERRLLQRAPRHPPLPDVTTTTRSTT